MDQISPNSDVLSALRSLFPDKSDKWEAWEAQLVALDMEDVSDIQGVTEELWSELAIDSELKQKLSLLRGQGAFPRSSSSEVSRSAPPPPPKLSTNSPKPPQELASADEKELWRGWVQKAGSGILGGGFKRRYIVVWPQKLQYFSDDTGVPALGEIPLKVDTKIAPSTTKEQPFGIDLIPAPGQRVYKLAAKDAAERNQLLELFGTACREVQQFSNPLFASSSSFNVGDHVELFGLSSGEFNGQKGQITFDPKNGRLEVRLANNQVARIKESNLKKLEGADKLDPRASSSDLWDGVDVKIPDPKSPRSAAASPLPQSPTAYATPLSPTSQEDYWDLSRAKGITFANSLTHCFDVVSNQVGVGIKSSKGLASLLKSIVEIQREANLKILALIEKEQRKAEEVLTGAKGLLSSLQRDLFINPKGKDGMEKFAGVYDKTMDFLRREAGQVIKDLDQFESSVIVPLVNHNLNNEGRLNAIGKTEKICRTEMQEASKAVKRCHEACDKLLDQVIQAKAKDPLAPKTIDPTAADKKMKLLAKVQHKITTGQLVSPKKLQKMAYTAANDYEAAVTAANARQTQFITSDLPNLFHQLEGLERTRLEEVSKILVKQAEEKIASVEPRRVGTARLLKDTQELDTAGDMKSFLHRWISFAGFPPPPVPFTYQLSCSPEDIAKGRFENTNSYFGNTLEAIMKMQHAAFPEEKVPHIVEASIKAVGDLGGFKAEGIFRISIPKAELEGLQRRFDNGEHQFEKDPNAPACLLKQWLRLLEEPVVPTAMYAQAINLGSENSVTPAILQFFNQLPPVSQAVIQRITTGLVGEIIKPENVETNRMNIRNLAIVFSPGFLRNPSDDPMEMLNSAKFETQFTVLLFEALLNKPK